jgi:hypothetical protein
MTSLSRLCLSLGVPLDSVIEVVDSDDEPTHSVIEVFDSDDEPTHSAIEVFDSDDEPTHSVIEVFDSDDEPTHSVIEVFDSDDKSLPKEKGRKCRHESEDEVDVVHEPRTTEEQYSFTQMDLGLRRAVFPVYVTQKKTHISRSSGCANRGEQCVRQEWKDGTVLMGSNVFSKRGTTGIGLSQ